MEARFVGDPRDGGSGPATVTVGGVIFSRDEFRDVPPELADKIDGNSHFETQGKAPEGSTAPRPEPAKPAAELRKPSAATPGPAEIPNDWAKLSFLAKRSLAKKLDPLLDKGADKATVEGIIRDEVARREALAGN